MIFKNLSFDYLIVKREKTTMYKSLALLCLIAIVGVVNGSKGLIQSKHIQRVQKPINNGNNAIDWCPQCIDTWDDIVEVVLDIFLQYGVVDTCGHLGNLVTKETGSGLLGFICTMGCDFVGLEEFAKLVTDADIDPIYYCERMNLCPSK